MSNSSNKLNIIVAVMCLCAIRVFGKATIPVLKYIFPFFWFRERGGECLNFGVLNVPARGGKREGLGVCGMGGGYRIKKKKTLRWR